MLLLDTNVVIGMIRGEGPRQLEPETAVSAITVFELWYGVLRSRRREANTASLRAFLAGPVAVLGMDEEDAVTAAEVRAHLERDGAPIGPYDLLIAGQALRRDATLWTANAREFRRVPGLRWRAWRRAAGG